MLFRSRAVWNGRARLAASSGLHIARIEHLLGRYGTAVTEILDLIAADRSLAQPLAGAEDYLCAEVVYAAGFEGATHLDDVLARRMRVSFETFDRGVGAARPTAELMAGVLDWDKERIDREVGHYEAQILAERESQRQPDDQSADAVRLAVSEI